MHQGDDIKKEILEKAKEVQYKIDAVAHHVSQKVPTVRKDDTILQLKAMLLENANRFDTINYVYVLSDKKKLKGVASIKEVLSADPSKKISEIMVGEDLITAHPHTDQEKVAHKALKHNLKSIPIVDKNNKFIGVVPSDQILSILDQESKEDLLRFSGYMLDNEDDSRDESKLPVLRSFQHRIPWILFGLFGGLFTAQIISKFDGILTEYVILASFIPLVAYVANAVGVQTQTVFIRDLAVRGNINYYKYSLKQALVAILIAITCWAAILFMAVLSWQESYLGIVVGAAVFSAILMATFFAVLIPYSLNKLKMDPAIGSGPFTTIIQDFLSIVIYLAIATMLL